MARGRGTVEIYNLDMLSRLYLLLEAIVEFLCIQTIEYFEHMFWYHVFYTRACVWRHCHMYDDVTQHTGDGHIKFIKWMNAICKTISICNMLWNLTRHVKVSHAAKNPTIF